MKCKIVIKFLLRFINVPKKYFLTIIKRELPKNKECIEVAKLFYLNFVKNIMKGLKTDTVICLQTKF